MTKKLILFLAMTIICLAQREYYKTLGIQSNASQQEIKKAYRKLSQQFHPDRYQGDDNKMAAINVAYEVLSDQQKRAQYDQYGEQGLKEGGGGGGGFNDVFDFFGGNQKKNQQGPELFIKLQVTLEDIYNGREIQYFVTQQTLCPHCRGSGADDPEDTQTCNACGGKGFTIRRQEVMMGFYQQMQVQCDACKGKGKIHKTQCRVCRGSQIVPGFERLSVYIEQGIDDRKTMTYENSGDDHQDMGTSDIIFQIVTIPHPVFERNGNDLKIVLTLTLQQAMLGFKKKIKHLDDHYVKIHKTSITKNGDVQTLKGEGMPNHQYSSNLGDLHIHYKVNFPKTWSSEQLERNQQISKKFKYNIQLLNYISHTSILQKNDSNLDFSKVWKEFFANK